MLKLTKIPDKTNIYIFGEDKTFNQKLKHNKGFMLIAIVKACN